MADDNAPSKGGDIGSWVTDQWRRGDHALTTERSNYWLNLAFIEGFQWVKWLDVRREVVPFERDRPSRVQLVLNKMRPNLVNIIAKLSKRELGFEVLPTAADDGTLAGARLSEHLLEAQRVDQLWESLRRDELVDCFLGGTATVVVEWDPNAGDSLGFDHENGQVVNEGQVQLSNLAITEFTLEPGTRSRDDARWFIMAKSMPREQVKELYKLEELPAGDTIVEAGALQRGLSGSGGVFRNLDMATVLTFYERPHPGNKKGRWCVVVGGKTVVDKPWPFPFQRLNCYTFRQLQVPMRWPGTTMLNDARPLQAAYNFANSVLAEHMKLAGNARLAIPEGSNVEAEDLTDTAGEAVYYDGMSSSPPMWINPPNIPRWLEQVTQSFANQLDDVMSLHAISRGEAPGDRNSGLALSVLAEKDDTPLGLMAHDQSEGWGYIASIVLELWAAKVPETRTATVQTQTGIPLSIEWSGKHLRGQTRATVPLDNTLPHSRVALQAWIIDMYDRMPQMFANTNGAAMARMLDLPGASMFSEAIDQDVAQAEAENALMIIGEVPALDDRPFPMPFDNHAIHIAEHNRLRKSQAYMYATKDIREIIDLHVQAHENMAVTELKQQRELNTALPGGAAVPQAHEPVGSMVPPDHAERVASNVPAGRPHALPPGPAPSQPAGG